MIMGRHRKSHPQGDKKFEINPMHQSIGTRLDNLRRAPRCGATTRVGAPCQCPAMRGRKRCRLHGGISPGAPRGAQNGNFRDGTWTAEGIEERRWLRSLVRSLNTSSDEDQSGRCEALRR